MQKQAMYYKNRDNQTAECGLCPHHCVLHPDQVGLCRVRKNIAGEIYSLNYGEVAAMAIEPIEKKPLFHFHPGSLILSVGTFGCNLACGFCQNHSLAHGQLPARRIFPEELAAISRQAARQGSIGIAFTYNEPSIWYEYILEAAQELKADKQQIVLVSNGFIETEPLRELLPLVDAVNIDVKAFNNRFYQQHCRGRLEPVKKTVEAAAGEVHVEITTLLIPGENDNEGEIRQLAKWLASLDPYIPLHLSRYYPAYKFIHEPTPVETLFMARDIAREHLRFVYLGNLPDEQNNTCCQECGELLVTRSVYKTKIEGMDNGRCKSCGARVEYII